MKFLLWCQLLIIYSIIATLLLLDVFGTNCLLSGEFLLSLISLGVERKGTIENMWCLVNCVFLMMTRLLVICLGMMFNSWNCASHIIAAILRSQTAASYTLSAMLTPATTESAPAAITLKYFRTAVSFWHHLLSHPQTTRVVYRPFELTQRDIGSQVDLWMMLSVCL